MSTDDSSDSASFAAQHDVYARGKLKVAPTDGSTKFNTIRIPLIPVACWRLGDPGFAFDSSFVAPTFRDELTTLSGIVGANPECPAALFGHCDPAGSDALNKTLGDRRVIAIYALVTRQPALWADLYDKPEVGDRWGLHAVQTMLSVIVGRSTDDHGNAVADSASTPYYAGAIDGQNGSQTAGAVKAFQSDCGQSPSGTADAATRKVLFGAYMDALCTPAPTRSASNDPPASTPTPTAAATPPAPFRMQVTDFLGGAGAQPGDVPKMSLQGCSKFNPIVLLTNAEMQGYDGTTTRNADDAPNRRVVMFMFDKGTKVDSSVWPCPKVHESVDGCKAAFWSDGEQRRKNGDAKRVYKTTRDTMACRFYDRFARRSPCEGAQLPTRWVTWHMPYEESLAKIRLDLLDDGESVLKSITGAAISTSAGTLTFNLSSHSSDVARATSARLSTTGGVALEFAIPLEFVNAGPPQPTAATSSLQLVLIARLADGTRTTNCDFDVQVDSNPPTTVAPGSTTAVARVGSIIRITARPTSPDHWVLDDAVLKLEVLGPTRVREIRRHPDFKPVAMTNALSPSRLTCEYFLCKLKDFTTEGQTTIESGSPKSMTFSGDFIPTRTSERPPGLALPVPSFGPFDIAGATLGRRPASYAKTAARLVEIKDGRSPALGNTPRVVGVCWTDAGSTSPSDGGMDVLVMFSLPGAHLDFRTLQGENGHQHSFDYLWLYPYWWMNYFTLPTEHRQQASPPRTSTDFPPPGMAQDPFVFLGGGGRFRAGSGIAHQIAATQKPIMGLFPIPGGAHATTAEWTDPSAFSDFLYELAAMLRRQAGNYRPLGRGEHLGRVAIGGHSRTCVDVVLPTAKAWAAPGGPLAPHFVDAIFLDPPEGSTSELTDALSKWATTRGASSPLNICIETKAAAYVTGLGGHVAAGIPACSKQSSSGTTQHPAPIRFVFVPFNVWQGAWTTAIGASVITEHGLGFSGDDAHMCASYYGVFPCLVDSVLGT